MRSVITPLRVAKVVARRGILDRHATLLMQNYGNFRRSGEPKRFMYYEEGLWVDFREDVFGWLKSGFVEGRAVVEVEMEGLRWFFDFYRMVQIDLENGVQRSIAWVDVDGKCFFPKEFICERDCDGGEPIVVNVEENFNSENPKINVNIVIGGNSSNSSKRKGAHYEYEVKSVEEGIAGRDSYDGQKEPRAKRQQLIDSGVVDQPRWPSATLLNEEGVRASSMVKTLFLSALRTVEPDATITAVHGCHRTGPMAEVFQKQMEIVKNARGDANVRFAWYGTSAGGVEIILRHGFGMHNFLHPGLQSHRFGVCLFPVNSPQTSAMFSEVDENGEKHVILCQVILGKCEKVEPGSNHSYPSSLNFDSGVDDVQNPRWYLVWCSNLNSHILPKCVVSYKSSGRPSGRMQQGGTHQTKVLSSKLFSKLDNCLPPSKAQEFRKLCSTYTNGRLQKDEFVKQLRSMVGDDMLRSIVYEIRG